MKPHTLAKITVATGLTLALLSCLAGCGNKEQNASGAPGATPPGGATLSPQAHTAMEAQQQRESADRAAHAPPVKPH